MKIIVKLLYLSLLVIAFSACKKEDDPINIPQYDHSLIVASSNPSGNADKLIFVNPVDGKKVFVTAPNIANIKRFAVGNMSKKALLTSKTGAVTTAASLFVCDAKTGNPVQALTDENDLNVMDITGSPAEQKVAFTAKKTSGGEYFQLYTINEDGSGQAHISLDSEPVSGMDGKEYELLDIASPAFSPDGSQIAVNAHVDNTYPIPNSIFYDGVMVMNSDGSNKEFLFWEQGKDKGIENICWSQDGNFLIFKINDNDDNLHRRVNAINIASKNITDLTASMEIDGKQVWNLWTSPNSDKIVFNQHLVNGSDLFIAEFETHDDVLTIKGSPIKLTDKETSGFNYYNPVWQLWDEN